VGSGAENKKHYTINKKKSIKNTNKKHLGKAKNSQPTPVSPPRRGKPPLGRGWGTKGRKPLNKKAVSCETAFYIQHIN
jgi:hypothetical protein